MAKKSDIATGARPKPDSVPFDRDYRFPDDNKNVIRIWQNPPDGYPQIYKSFVNVAGTSHRRDNVLRFIIGSDRQVSLIWEKAGADLGLAVYGTWQERHGILRKTRQRKELLGYVPADMLHAIGDRDVQATLAAMYIPAGEKTNPGLRIDIWQA